MSNSPLISYTQLSPNNSGARNHDIDTVSIHCMAGDLSVESCGALFAKSSTAASSNYGIGSDGRIALYVDEANRSWCTSSASNDNRAVTIEVANCGGADEGWPVSDAAYASLIALLADICQRNGIAKLLWQGDKSLIGQADKQNMTVHRWFAAKACVPTYTEVLTENGWVRIDEVEIGDKIACATIDGLNISFEEVYDLVPIRKQDTYTNNGLTATKDHRIVFSRHGSKDFYRIDQYKNLLRDTGNLTYIPCAGYANADGLQLTNDMIAFYITMQADGHYMYEVNKHGEKRYYGIEFHLKKQRKIERIIRVLESIGLAFKITSQADGSTKIRAYNADGVNIVNDICEKYLHNKSFTWEWLELSKEQADFFLSEIQQWDGCVAGSLYTSKEKQNLDVVSAIAAINGVGSKLSGSNVIFRDSPYITLGVQEGSTKRNSRGRDSEVTCVSVKTGIFLIRQNGKTFIIGNCPGDWLYSRHGQIAAEVNTILEDENMDVERFKELWHEMRAELQDNDANDYSAAARDWAVANGIVQGGDSADFNGMWEDVLTREQMVTVLYRFAQLMGKA